MSNGDSGARPSAKVFMSYRRDDTAGHAGRLYDRINNHFGDRVKVFMDVDSIGPGEDFIKVIESAVGKCEILIAVIGRDWLTITDRAGNRRLDNPEDFIRVEIGAALKRNIRVIPVLVQDAVMPTREELPEALKDLSRRNAIELSDARWKYDVDRLIDTIEDVLSEQSGDRPGEGVFVLPQAAPRRPWPWLIAAAMAGLILVVALGIWLLLPQKDPPNNTNSPVVVASPSGTRDPNENRPASSSPTETPTSSPAPPERLSGIQVVRVNLRGGFSRGFFTSKGYIVAMVGEMFQGNETTTVTWSEGSQERQETVDVVKVNDWIALLKLRQGLLARDVPIRNSNSLRLGEAVERFINGNDRTPGTVVAINVAGIKPAVLRTTKISFRGEAGSPVIDSQGRIVAMVLGGGVDQTDSMPIETIKVMYPEAF